MQTFLPYKDFEQTARVLDYRRLGKQVEEVWQIYRAARYGGGWRNHPAVKMWQGSLLVLLDYGLVCELEWERRGYQPRVTGRRIARAALSSGKKFWRQQRRYPRWLGSPDFHLSHRSNLLRKKPEFYRRFWPTLRDDLSYVWPM